MTIATITVDLTQPCESQFQQFYDQLDALRVGEHRTALIKEIRVLCAEAVGYTSAGRDMFPDVVAAATSGTKEGVKALGGHTGNQSYVSEEHREKLRELAADLLVLS